MYRLIVSLLLIDDDVISNVKKKKRRHFIYCRVIYKDHVQFISQNVHLNTPYSRPLLDRIVFDAPNPLPWNMIIQVNTTVTNPAVVHAYAGATIRVLVRPCLEVPSCATSQIDGIGCIIHSHSLYTDAHMSIVEVFAF